MGGGSWNVTNYNVRAQHKAAQGKSTFDYNDRIRRGQAAAAVHTLLDPKSVNHQGMHTGQNIREVILTDEHANPTPIAVVLDVTGSNYEAAVTVHRKLPKLHGLLQLKGYVENPQLLFAAIGDAFTDRVPLQIGQFESGNAMDEQLEAMYLEGNGGGQMHETYELAAYFLARHTYLESFERFGRKGYAIFIGDEMPYDTIRCSYGVNGFSANHTLASLIGDKLEADIPTRQIFAELQQRYEVFFLFQAQGSYRKEDILPTWRQLIGERALVLEDPNAVCEFIAGLLGMMEAGRSADEAEQDLLTTGADRRAVIAASKALKLINATSARLVRGTQSLPDTGRTNGTTRL